MCNWWHHLDLDQYSELITPRPNWPIKWPRYGQNTLPSQPQTDQKIFVGTFWRFPITWLTLDVCIPIWCLNVEWKNPQLNLMMSCISNDSEDSCWWWWWGRGAILVILIFTKDWEDQCWNSVDDSFPNTFILYNFNIFLRLEVHW